MRIQPKDTLLKWLVEANLPQFIQGCEVNDADYAAFYQECGATHPDYSEEQRSAWAAFSALTHPGFRPVDAVNLDTGDAMQAGVPVSGRTIHAIHSPVEARLSVAPVEVAATLPTLAVADIRAHLDGIPSRIDGIPSEINLHVRMDARPFWAIVAWAAVVLLLLLFLTVKSAKAAEWSQITVIKFLDSSGTPIKSFAAPFSFKCGTGTLCAVSGSTMTVTITGAPPTGSCGGDLSGTYPNCGVAKINGTSVPANSAADQFLGTTSSATGAWASVPNCGDTSHALAYNTTTHLFSCQSVTGSAGSPGGSSGDIQYNNAGSFGGITATRGALIYGSAAGTWSVRGVQAAGKYPKWDGTDLGVSTLAASGTGSCTNQVVTAANADAAPTCTTITSAYVDSSIATGFKVEHVDATVTSITGSTSETTIASYTLAANELGSNQALYSIFKGRINATGSPNLTLRLYFGATVVNTWTWTSNAINRQYTLDATIIPSGAAGAAVASEIEGGSFVFSSNALAGTSNTTTANLATNGSAVIKLTAQWSGSDASIIENRTFISLRYN